MSSNSISRGSMDQFTRGAEGARGAGSKDDERSFSLGLHKLPAELLLETMRMMQPQDLLRFIQTEKYPLALIKPDAGYHDSGLLETIGRARAAKKATEDLRKAGHLDPANLNSRQIYDQLSPHFGYVDEGLDDDLIHNTVMVGTVSSRSAAVAHAAKEENWKNLTRAQRNVVLDGAMTINDPQWRQIALTAIGEPKALELLTLTQQQNWAAAVAHLPTFFRVALLSQLAPLRALNDESHAMLRQNLMDLPSSVTNRNYALSAMGDRFAT